MSDSPDTTTQIRQKLSKGGDPWVQAKETPDSPILKEIKALLRGCCARNPLLRPPAASVAHSIFIVLASNTALMQPSQQSGESVQNRVKNMLDKVQKTSKDTPAELSSAAISTIDVAELRALAYQGDPVASALLGSCIWRGLITAEDKEGRCVSLEDEEISLGENPSFLPTPLRV